MAGRARKRLSAGTRAHLDALEDTLWRLEHGTPLAEGLVDNADNAYERAVHAAIDKGSEQQRTRVRYARIVGWPQAIAENVRRLREQAGWTQAQLAQAMRKAGFGWTRVTVTEAEGGSRRIVPEELLTLAGLFAEPMANLLLPFGPDAIEMPALPKDGEEPGYISRTRAVDRDDLVAAMLGHTWRVGELSPASAEPARVVGVNAPGSRADWRPAKDLHERRAQGYAR